MDIVLSLACPDQPGIVARVTQFLFTRDANITESQQFDDFRSGKFFMRIVCQVPDGESVLDDLRAAFEPLAQALEMTWDMWDAKRPYRALIMVSRFGHCLNDLLYRWSTGALNIEIPAIVSNHADMESLATSYGIPYVHIPVTAQTKPEAEARLREVVAELDIDLVVLARYMQVLSDEMSRDYSGRIINIHHSFLPSFKGAKPYHQAFERGVKQIGATAHYVTADLDEGPIIEQDVIRVDHRMSAEDLVRAGQECEARVLARAVKWHSESRVILNVDRTVVFS